MTVNRSQHVPLPSKCGNRLHCLLKEKRIALNLTVKEAAAKCGIALATYWTAEDGGQMTVRIMRTIARGFGVAPVELWPWLAEVEIVEAVEPSGDAAAADLGPQKSPSSIRKIQAEVKQVTRELEGQGSEP